MNVKYLSTEGAGKGSVTPSHSERLVESMPDTTGPAPVIAPIKTPDSVVDVQPEIPKVGSRDAPGG